MTWFGKSSKREAKNNMESLGIRFEPIVFHPDRNEYELHIELTGCPKDLVKVTYEKALGKLKVTGQKHKTEFDQEFTIPDDCLAARIYGRFRGDVLHVFMPRLLSEFPRFVDASSNQAEHDHKASSDREATAEAGEDRDEFSEPPPLPDQKTTNELKKIDGKIQRRNSSSAQGDDLEAPSDRENLPARAPAPLPSDQKSTEEVKKIGGKDRDKLPARVPAQLPSDLKSSGEMEEREGKDRDKLLAKIPAPLPSPSPYEPKTVEKLRRRDSDMFPEISAPPPSALQPSRSVKKLKENYQRILSKIAAPPPPPPPPCASATAPWSRKGTDKRGRQEEEEEDQNPPSTVVPASPSSDQNKSKQKDVESGKPVAESDKNEKKSEIENGKNAKFVTEPKDKEESKVEQPSGGRTETLGLVAKVKETGKAAVTAVMNEDNRLVVMIGAAVLTIVVIGASLKSKRVRN